jgi:transporter family protein
LLGSHGFFSYMALSQLPITIVVLIRATGPVWVLFGALFIYNEKFTGLQWAGIITVLVFFYIFSLAGRREGIRFLRNKWIIAIIGATLLGAVSGLYDKYLLMNFNRMAVQSVVLNLHGNYYAAVYVYSLVSQTQYFRVIQI